MIHQAIYNTHSNVRAIRDNEDGTVVCLDQDENVVTLDGSEVEESTRLQAEYDSQQYARDRATAYPSLTDQADMQYWDSVNDTTAWADAIAAVKAEFPKP
jgi:uncharacterized protein YcbX